MPELSRTGQSARCCGKPNAACEYSELDLRTPAATPRKLRLGPIREFFGALIGEFKGASGMDLTFATRLAANSASECQILNSTRNIDLLVVLLILTFAKVKTEKGCERHHRTTSVAECGSRDVRKKNISEMAFAGIDGGPARVSIDAVI
jgi:hypothetical protein